jgi:hypothetical protein
MNLRIDIQAGTGMRELTARLRGAGRREMIGAAGYEVQRLTTDHLRALAASRHTTAQRLGAAPSGHLAQAAEKVPAPGALTTIGTEGDAQAVLSIRHPGLSRAFKDVTIRPVAAKALTIPIHALAYNRRAGQIAGLFRIGNVLAIKDGTTVVPLYALVRSVTQKQDRSLLPSDEALQEAASRGARRYIAAALQQKGNL